MAKRTMSETGLYHITARAAGKIALFEDDNDRRKYLRLLKAARDSTEARVVAWVLMTDHIHLVVDFGEHPGAIADFMFQIDSPYSRYFNAKTGREGTLFQGNFWSKPIANDAQLMATVYYVHMNPEAAGIAPMREYHWSSYQEYAGTHWVVDTSMLLEMFGSFDAFDSYVGSPWNVVSDEISAKPQDGDVLARAIELADVDNSSELRSLPPARRNELIRILHSEGLNGKMIARSLGIGTMTVSRALRQ